MRAQFGSVQGFMGLTSICSQPSPALSLGLIGAVQKIIYNQNGQIQNNDLRSNRAIAVTRDDLPDTLSTVACVDLFVSSLVLACSFRTTNPLSNGCPLKIGVGSSGQWSGHFALSWGLNSSISISPGQSLGVLSCLVVRAKSRKELRVSLGDVTAHDRVQD